MIENWGDNTKKWAGLHENIKAGDRIKAYCYDVREPRGHFVRAHPKFMEKLFVQEVPEIYDGLIEIKSSSRDPGSEQKFVWKL